MGVNSLPKTVTQQRRACDFWTQALLRMSPAWVRFLVYSTGLVQYRWTGLDLLTADRLKIQDWKIVNLRFPPLHIRTCVFRTCIFHPPVLSLSVLAFSVAPWDWLEQMWIVREASQRFLPHTTLLVWIFSILFASFSIFGGVTLKTLNHVISDRLETIRVFTITEDAFFVETHESSSNCCL